MVKPRKYATMNDVAKAAGVSKSAVSKALNNKFDISKDVRNRILKACEELGYQVNFRIQDLVRERKTHLSRNIAFVIVGRDFADPAYARAVDGIAKGARECNLHLMLETLRGDEASTCDFPPVLRDGRVDGIVITGNLNESIVSALRKLAIPCVILGTYNTAIAGSSISVAADMKTGISLIVAGLKKNGSRRIAYFTENPDNFREAGNISFFKSALLENGLEFSGKLLYTGSGPSSGAHAAMKPVFMLLKLPFDAIVCLDYRTAQEISVLIMMRCGFNRPPETMIGLLRPFDYYHLPVPAIYMEGLLDKVAYEGIKTLWTSIAEGDMDVSKRIMLTPEIAVENLHMPEERK